MASNPPSGILSSLPLNKEFNNVFDGLKVLSSPKPFLACAICNTKTLMDDQVMECHMRNIQAPIFFLQNNKAHSLQTDSLSSV